MLNLTIGKVYTLKFLNNNFVQIIDGDKPVGHYDISRLISAYASFPTEFDIGDTRYYFKQTMIPEHYEFTMYERIEDDCGDREDIDDPFQKGKRYILHIDYLMNGTIRLWYGRHWSSGERTVLQPIEIENPHKGPLNELIFVHDNIEYTFVKCSCNDCDSSYRFKASKKLPRYTELLLGPIRFDDMLHVGDLYKITFNPGNTADFKHVTDKLVHLNVSKVRYEKNINDPILGVVMFRIEGQDLDFIWDSAKQAYKLSRKMEYQPRLIPGKVYNITWIGGDTVRVSTSIFLEDCPLLHILSQPHTNNLTAQAEQTRYSFTKTGGGEWRLDMIWELKNDDDT